MTTLATCWKITREDAVVLGFTDHDETISISGVDYLPAYGYSPSSIENNSDGTVNNMEVSGILHTSGIDINDVRAGLYDYALVECFFANWLNNTVDTILIKGWLGKVSIKDESFQSELLGLLSKLQRSIGSLYLPHCDAELGDTRCGYSLSPIVLTVTVGSDKRTFTASGLTQADDYFKGGKLTWLTGNNTNFTMDIKEFGSGVVELYEPMPYTIDIGDTANIYQGCDGTLNTCKTVFDNVVNFRGFPHLPGMSEILR